LTSVYEVKPIRTSKAYDTIVNFSSESEDGNQIQEQPEKKSKKAPTRGKNSTVKTPTPSGSRTKKKNKTAGTFYH